MNIDRQELIDISHFYPNYFHKHSYYYTSLKRDDLTKYIDIYLDKKIEGLEGVEDEYILNEKGRKIFKKHFLIDPFKLLDTVYQINSDVYKKNVIYTIKERFKSDFEKFENLYVSWFNRQIELYLVKMLNNKNVLLFNQLNKLKYFFPEPIPETVKIYRGIKNVYIKERDRKYSSWTLNIEEANRFAKYHFNRYSPREAEIQTILELEIKTSDIDLFIIGYEDEVVIKNVNDRFGNDIKVIRIK